MSFLKLSFEKKIMEADDNPQEFFEHINGDYACLFGSGKESRYSYIAYDPFLVVWSDSGVAHMIQKKDFFNYKKSGIGQIIEIQSQFALADILKNFELKVDCPVPFAGGAAGFVGYDYGCLFNGIEQKVFDDLDLPDYAFNFYDKVIAFDHEEKVIYFIGLGETDLSAKRKIEEMKNDLQRELPLKRAGEVGNVSSNISEDVYIEKVEQIKDLLRQGETYQVNFSQRFKADCTLDGWNMYKKLVDVNPAPFSCYLNYPDYKIVSSSPELLLSKRGDKLETWPIKGTVKRGENEEEDVKLIDELLKSEKEDAELSMIVDLERNDLGKVCEIGSVEVKGHREIMKCSHVIHTYSRVAGRLDKKKDIFDALRAIFPSGSITGCPKRRTMEIIDKFEDYKRGIYTGTAGFISFSGDCDFNILIRTMLLKDDVAYFNAGGGIVMDSDPKKEYEESVMKAQALIDILR